jgi:RTA1 like protein
MCFFFHAALWLATICIWIRSVFRVVELNQGFDGPIANNEPSFLVFEGPMIILATGALAVFHPGYSFAGNWEAANWSLSGKDKENKDEQAS